MLPLRHVIIIDAVYDADISFARSIDYHADDTPLFR